MQNIVILAGNVGANPESRTTQGGATVTNFSLATSRPKRDSEGKVLKDGEGRRIEDTEWHRVTCFSGLAKTVAQYAEKGQKLMVRGRIHYTRWTDDENIERYGVEIIADEVTFLSRGKGQQGTSGKEANLDIDDDGVRRRSDAERSVGQPEAARGPDGQPLDGAAQGELAALHQPQAQCQ